MFKVTSCDCRGKRQVPNSYILITVHSIKNQFRVYSHKKKIFIEIDLLFKIHCGPVANYNLNPQSVPWKQKICFTFEFFINAQR